MNKLKFDQQCQVVTALCEGNSIRGIERMTGVHRDTIMRLGVRVGEACANLLDDVMKAVPSKRIEVDEIWTFVGKKQRHLAPGEEDQYGDTWTFVALDPETKIIPAYHIGKRTLADTQTFIHDLAYRLKYRVQLSSDGMNAYVEAIDRVFGSAINYAQIVKSYEAEPVGPGGYQSDPADTHHPKSQARRKRSFKAVQTKS